MLRIDMVGSGSKCGDCNALGERDGSDGNGGGDDDGDVRMWRHWGHILPHEKLRIVIVIVAVLTAAACFC